MAASDIPLARAALAALRRGARPTRDQRAALRRVDRLVDAKQPLSAYAPRTQRRYLNAAALGADAKTANRIDYEQKRIRQREGPRIQTRDMRTLVEEQAARNAALLGDNVGQFDDDQIDELIAQFGLRGALAILKLQYDSIQAYRDNNPEVGRARWYDRLNIIERYRTGMGYDEYSVPYFWYHGRK